MVRLYGVSGAAGEIGHITVVTENAFHVIAGSLVVETVASATGIVRVAMQKYKRLIKKACCVLC